MWYIWGHSLLLENCLSPKPRPFWGRIGPGGYRVQTPRTWQCCPSSPASREKTVNFFSDLCIYFFIKYYKKFKHDANNERKKNIKRNVTNPTSMAMLPRFTSKPGKKQSYFFCLVHIFFLSNITRNLTMKQIMREKY